MIEAGNGISCRKCPQAEYRMWMLSSIVAVQCLLSMLTFVNAETIRHQYENAARVNNLMLLR